jgi:hypothetical protein
MPVCNFSARCRRLPEFTTSADVEVQERACTVHKLLNVFFDERAAIGALLALIDGEVPARATLRCALLCLVLCPNPRGVQFNPVSAKAQRRVKPPPGLDLDVPLMPDAVRWWAPDELAMGACAVVLCLP